jgi:RES domain-containing protein
MLVYRLTKEKYKDSLSGKGAAIMGGRWNSPGVEIIYAASNRALAMSEVAVHVTFEMMPHNYWMMEIELPEKDYEKIIDLPKKWNAFPYAEATRAVGDKFVLEQNALAIKVPSAVVQGEWNILINPNHKNFDQVKIIKAEPFSLDRRLF